MSEPTDLLQGVRASTADLLLELDTAGWSDTDVRAPSLCEGWTRGHVLTHIARNADAIGRTLAGALRNEVVPIYPDGRDARNAAIEDGAGRAFAELVADVRDATERLDRVMAALSEADAWDRPADRGETAGAFVGHRWSEVEIHRIDLDGGYTAQRWPPLFVSTSLPVVASTLPARASGPVRVEVVADGSLGPECVGTVWSVDGSGDRDGSDRDGSGGAVSGRGAVEVRGPDWAVLAWLVGRPSAAEGALTAMPPLADWR